MPEPDAGQIDRAARLLAACRTRGELGRAIAQEAACFSMYDLQRIGGGIRREIEALPEPYRSRVSPYFEEQIFGAYHRLMCAHRTGAFARMDGAIPDPERFFAFVALIKGGCLDRTGSQTDIGFSNPLHTLFYYLVTGYAMFVEGGPGHPVGTPFPGGFTVEKRGAEYYCPIRDKEEDVPFSICNVCPARQMEGV